MSGYCYKCNANTSQKCVGCRSQGLAYYVCDRCVLPCAWCGEQGPYCTNCTRCKNDTCRGDPGYHNCWGCDKTIELSQGDLAFRCADEDKHDGRYCEECIFLCSCGENHMVCCKEEHECSQYNCTRRICLSKGGLFDDDVVDNLSVFCDEHIPEFSQRVCTIVYEREQKRRKKT